VISHPDDPRGDRAHCAPACSRRAQPAAQN
jgi:hypothetical protein